MATETIAPAPPGVQTTFDKPLGPQPSKSERAGKWKKAFDELTHEDVKPQGQETKVEEPPKEAPKPAEPPVEPPKEAPPSTSTKDEKPPDKPTSPLEAVLAAPTKETPPVEEPDVLKEFDEKTANWQRAREVMKTQSTDLKTLREKVKALETAPKAEPSVVEELTKQRDDFKAKFEGQEEKLKAINYQYSDEFQGMLSAKENDVAKLSSRIKAHGGDAVAVIAALALPEGKVRTAQIEEALSDVDSKNRGRIDMLIDKIEEHDEKISDATKKSAPKWDELQAQRDAQLAEQSQSAIKQIEAEFRKVADELPNEVITLREVPEDVPDATSWNKDIRAADETALRVLKPNGADFKESATIAKQGAHYPFLMKRFLSMYSDFSELKKQYNELAGSGPDFKGGTKPVSEAPKKPGMKYREALAIAQSEGAGQA